MIEWLTMIAIAVAIHIIDVRVRRATNIATTGSAYFQCTQRDWKYHSGGLTPKLDVTP